MINYAAIQQALRPVASTLSLEAIDALERQCAKAPVDPDPDWNPPLNLDDRKNRPHLRMLIQRLPRSLWRVLYGVAGAMCLPYARQAWQTLAAGDRAHYAMLEPSWAEGVEELAQRVLKLCTTWPPPVPMLQALHNRLSLYEESFEFTIPYLELGITERVFSMAERGIKLYRAIIELLAYASMEPGSNNPLVDSLTSDYTATDPSWPIVVAYRLMGRTEAPSLPEAFLARWWRVCQCMLAFQHFKGQEVAGAHPRWVGASREWTPPMGPQKTRRGFDLGPGDRIHAGDQGQTRLDPSWLPVGPDHDSSTLRAVEWMLWGLRQQGLDINLFEGLAIEFADDAVDTEVPDQWFLSLGTTRSTEFVLPFSESITAETGPIWNWINANPNVRSWRPIWVLLGESGTPEITSEAGSFHWGLAGLINSVAIFYDLTYVQDALQELEAFIGSGEIIPIRNDRYLIERA